MYVCVYDMQGIFLKGQSMHMSEHLIDYSHVAFVAKWMKKIITKNLKN